ncbi:MAG: TIGR00725 family protein [Actinomycetota bacterium]
MSSDTIYVAVVGAGGKEPVTDAAAEESGRLIAERGGVVVCGGLGGVMEAACRGAKNAGGATVGILPSAERRHANPYVDVAIATGIGEMRNALIVRTSDVLLAIGGEYGTLSEIAFALKIGRPVVGVGSWDLARAKEGATGMIRAASPAEAVEAAFDAARARR